MLDHHSRHHWVSWVLALAVALLGMLAMAGVESRNHELNAAESAGGPARAGGELEQAILRKSSEGDAAAVGNGR